MPVNTTHRSSFAGSPGRNRLVAMLAGAAALAVACAVALGGGNPRASEPAASFDQQHSSLRIGIYDSRAVAVAYVRSAEFAAKMQDLHRQRAEAEKAGDKKRIAELESLGESVQVRMHLQGFSVAPVDDLLDTVRDELAGVAQRNSVMAIARAMDYRAASVEAIDVTDDLVRLFEPNEQTLKVIAELRKQKPVAIEVAAKMPAKQ